MKLFKIIYFGLLLIVCSCKTLNTDLSTPEREAPTSFSKTSTDTTSIAKINWKDYFADEHLISLIDTALVNNHDLQMALQRIEIARSGVRFSSGELFPKIDGNIAAGSTKYAKYTESFAGNSTTEFEGKGIPNPVEDYFLGLTATWEVDIWGKLRNSRKAAISNYLASIEGNRFVMSNLIAATAIAYYDLLALDNELETLEQTIKMQHEALEVVQLQKEVGQANELAVQQFQAQLLNTQALKKNTLQQIVETENRVNFLLGRYPQPIERTKEKLFREVPQQIAFGVPSQLLLNRPDIREAEFQVQASKFDLKAAKAAFFPSFNIGAALGFQAFNLKYLFKSPASIGYAASGGLIAPLVNRNALKAEFNTAKANQLTVMYNYQKTILNGYVEVANELSNIQQLRDIISLKSQENEVLENAIVASKEFYRMAKANYLEVLMAQQNSLQTKLELIDVNKQQQIATVNIYKVLGGGW
ncbi:TolC family protein [Arenibacter palladensis]|uniref:TolC family protein n=1 Tax=Arenibacter palladensis TaxID=237373 RepID=UPI0026E15B89|nr:TolC family protein [Arenibacter palladensis]MDO6603460.1 TolC family protein [Arenibacter palladensis]